MSGIEVTDDFERDISQALEGEEMSQKGPSWRQIPVLRPGHCFFTTAALGTSIMLWAESWHHPRRLWPCSPWNLALLRSKEELNTAGFLPFPQFIGLYKGHVAAASRVAKLNSTALFL